MISRNGGPDFIGVGVQRGGTSWLYECLNEHPEVNIPEKELHFFDRNYDRGIEWYKKLFQCDGENKVSGEYTPDYISSEEAMQRIFEFDSNVKLIVILREPLDRAYSAYRLFQSHGQFCDLEFAEAIKLHPWFFEKSLYSDQIKGMFSLFSSVNIHIDFYDRIISDPESFFGDICQFIGVDRNFTPKSLFNVRNASFYPGIQNRYGLVKLQNKIIDMGFSEQLNSIKNTRLFSIFKRFLLDKDRKKQPSHLIDRKYISIVKDDVEVLEELLGQDLQSWKDKYVL
ncbi:sulfotransferase family protein [Marinobacter sp. F4216]|uniref:sulfotransferase family protein n=1 Tax=Marinobacter sp. F4216 TaxID=2874281 RepID=UPI001CC178EA|nr:sulfotransferase [Marinobacter sp. F4216]MBZ2167685.1 sulfotransferase domain-containing protein [Marinobacter sp. F4216]